MSNKSRIIKIITILIIFVILFMNVANAETFEGLLVKVGALNKQDGSIASDSEWFGDESITKLVGQEVNYNYAPIDKKGAYCLDESTSNWDYNMAKKVNTVIDINNDEVENGAGKIIVYSLNGTYSYNISDVNSDIPERDGIYEVLRLAYLTKIITQNGESIVNFDSGAGVGKMTLSCFLNDQSVINNLNKVNVMSGMSMRHSNPDIAWLKRHGGYGNTALEYLHNAELEAIKTVSSISDKTQNKDNVTVEFKDGKTYIGPYRVAYSGGNISEIKITTETETLQANTISYDIKETKNIAELESDKDFYIVVDKEISNSINDIIISVDGVKSSKARIVILDGEYSQHFVVYKGKDSNSSSELHLEVPKLGNLEIQKVDQFEDSTVSLKDIEFKVYASNKGWLVQDGETITFNNAKNAFDTVKPFKTDENGKISIKNIPTGYYYIYETGLPENLEKIYQLGMTNVPGKDEEVKGKIVVSEELRKAAEIAYRIPVSAGQTITVKAVNDRAYTDVYVHKVDYDTQKPLNGYEFRLYRVDGDNTGWVEAENNVATHTYTKDFKGDKVAKLLTEQNGTTPTLESLEVGTYELYETRLGENGEAYDLGKFEKDNNEYDGKLIDTKTVKAKTTGVFPFEESNKQEFIKISGRVWEDVLGGKNTQKYDAELTSSDMNVKGIEVLLFDINTQEHRTAYTNEDGTYSFENVRIRASDKSEKVDYLKYYVIMFKYDGYIYQSTLSNAEEVKLYNDDGTINETFSKAFEYEDMRPELNKLFDNITGEGQQLSNGVTLRYNKSEEGIITLDNTAKRTVVRAPKAETQEIGEVHIEGSTDFEMRAITPGKILQEYYNKLKTTQDVVTEIGNINLGVYLREMPNIRLEKNIHDATVKVNGKEYTYRYDQQAENPTETTIGAQFDSNYESLPALFPIYKADVEYNPAETDLALHSTITYKIELQNLSPNLYSTVNGLEEWYSKYYSLAKDQNGEYAIYLSDNKDNYNETDLVKTNKNRTDSDKTIQVSNYKRASIQFTDPVKLSPRGTKYLFIKFDLDRENIKQIYNKDTQLENFAEIRSYTTYSDAEYKNLYAGVDYTSIPGNLNADRYTETDEDDSDKARGLKLVDAGERKLSGTVFVDEDADGKVGANQERIGNGIFDDGEKTISNVSVQLVDEKGNKVQVYNGTDWVDSDITKTDENGNFTISGFLPGTYQVVYTWGDDKYKVEDYKGTIYVAPNDWLTNPTRYSDAWDDYGMRLVIDKNALNIDDSRYSPDEMNRMNIAEAKAGTDNIKQMESTTPVFAIGIERADYDELPGDVGEKTEKDGTKYIFKAENIDFGIIERPRQAMEINKDLKSIKLTATDGTLLVDAQIQDDNTLKATTGEKWVSGGGDMGYIWVQVDKSITQSMKAEMGYNITVSNVSEIDYDNEAYYTYGTKTGDPSTMKLRAEEVYDYCKGASLSTVNDTTVWETVEPGNYKIETTTGETITEANFNEQFNKIVDEDGNIRSDYTWENSYSETGKIFEDWLEQMAVEKKTEVRSVKLADREILKYVGDELTKELAPGESKTAEIKTSKLISNGDDIRFDNDAEISNITFTTDQKTGRKPSAYTSKTYDRGGWASITPATGEDRDYTWIIITAVSAVAVLGVGIVIIKKKVLK